MRTFLPKEKEQSQLQERRHPDRESALGGCSHTGGWQVFTGEAMPIRLVLLHLYNHQFSSVQLLSWVHLFAIPWTTARQASLSITNSRSLLKLMPIESVMPSNHLILCHPFLLPPSIFPQIMFFPMNQFFTTGGQSIEVSASASVLPMNIQNQFPLG